MKVSLNLATPPSHRERYGFAWAIPTALVAAAVLALMSVSTVRAFLQYRAAQKALDSVATREQDLKSRLDGVEEQLRRPQPAELFAETRFVNRLIAERQFSLIALASQASNLLPPDARLAELGIGAWNPEKSLPTVRFAVEAKDMKAAENFLTNLEDSPAFSDVIVRDQGLEQGQNSEGDAKAGSGLVLLVCTATYAPTQEEAAR